MRTTCERLPDGEPSFREDLRWAREHPEYWAEGLKLEASDAINGALEAQGVSRAELARRLDCTPAFVTKILRGYHNLSLDTLARVGVALGIQWKLAASPSLRLEIPVEVTRPKVREDLMAGYEQSPLATAAAQVTGRPKEAKAA